MSGQFEMSATLKVIIAITLVCAIAFFVMLSQNQSAFEAQQLPNGDLSTLQSMGRSEVKSFASWCEQQGHQGDTLEACVKRRQARAQVLVAQSKCSREKALGQFKGLGPAERSRLAQIIIKARQPSIRERLAREERSAQDQGQSTQTSTATDTSAPTEQEFIQLIQSRFISTDLLEVSKCAYEKICQSRGYSGGQLAECVTKMQ